MSRPADCPLRAAFAICISPPASARLAIGTASPPDKTAAGAEPDSQVQFSGSHGKERVKAVNGRQPKVDAYAAPGCFVFGLCAFCKMPSTCLRDITMRHILFTAALALLPSAGFAQSAPDPTVSDDRFQIERQGDQFVRLDKKTGAMSVCTLENSALDCRAGADERAALSAEIERLSKELEQVRTAQAGDNAPSTGISKDGKELTLKLPTESEIKDVVAYLEDIFRRFVEAVKDFANDIA
jgi:hypothetical protein